MGSLRDREGACSASDRQGSNFESCVWRTVSSHHPQEVLLAQFSLYVHKGGLKPDSFFFVRLGRHKVQVGYLKCTLSPIHANWIVIRILYPERNPDHPHNVIEFSLAHIIVKVSCKSVFYYLSPPMDRQTDRVTDQAKRAFENMLSALRVNPYSAGIYFRYLKSITACKSKTIYNGRKPIT